MTKAFVSYHHANDQVYKEHLAYLAKCFGAFEDCSVEVGEIDDDRSSESIRTTIRDNYLRDSEVTILLCGTETRFRKHIDWELKSSMINGTKNKQSGILVIDLPTTSCTTWHAGLHGEHKQIYWDYCGSWINIESKSQYRARYPDLPERIIDNLNNAHVAMSVVPWHKIKNQPENLRFLVNATAVAGRSNQYDTSLPMKRKNYNPKPAYNLRFG